MSGSRRLTISRRGSRSRAPGAGQSIGRPGARTVATSCFYGDPRTEEGRKLLAERSPINKVENIRKPMLIFHGANDVRCKVAESDTIVAAMQQKNIPVTYVVYPDEGHGFQKPPNRLSYTAMTEAFFARHLGGAFEPIGGDLEGSSHEIRAGAEVLKDLGIV
jgi:acetyl esterase/lipase